MKSALRPYRFAIVAFAIAVLMFFGSFACALLTYLDPRCEPAYSVGNPHWQCVPAWGGSNLMALSVFALVISLIIAAFAYLDHND